MRRFSGLALVLAAAPVSAADDPKVYIELIGQGPFTVVDVHSFELHDDGSVSFWGANTHGGLIVKYIYTVNEYSYVEFTE